MELSFVPSRRAAYSRAAKKFVEVHVESRWRSSWLVPVDVVMRFVAHLHHSGLFLDNMS